MPEQLLVKIGKPLVVYIFLDIKKGFNKIDIKDQTILRLRYHENFTLAQIAHTLECATSTADRRCTQALRRLQNELGGESPFR